MARRIIVNAKVQDKKEVAPSTPAQSVPSWDEIEKDAGITNSGPKVFEADARELLNNLQMTESGPVTTINTPEANTNMVAVKAKLDVLIDNYHRENELKNKYTKNCKENGNSIKELMMENNLSTFLTDTGIQATVSVTEKVSFNEEELLAYCKTLNIPGLVKTKEYVDMEVLEDAIYHKDVDAAKLDPYQIKEPGVVRLTTKIPKKKVVAE